MEFHYAKCGKPAEANNENHPNYRMPRITSKVQPMVFTHTRPSEDEDESPMETANKILKRSREEKERLAKVNDSPTANRIIMERNNQRHRCEECDISLKLMEKCISTG